MTVSVALVAEDFAFESLLRSIISRCGDSEGRTIELQVVSARGGWPAVASSIANIVSSIAAGKAHFDVIVVAVDTNCRGRSATVRRLSSLKKLAGRAQVVYALPEPHIERWYFSHLPTSADIFGIAVALPAEKCARDRYKEVLREAARDATGNETPLGGVEFGHEIGSLMPLDDPTLLDAGLGRFVKDLRGAIRTA